MAARMMTYNDGGTAMPCVFRKPQRASFRPFRHLRARRAGLRGGGAAEGGGAFADRG